MTFFTIDDDEIAADTREVLAASSLLEITEFRLFELAHQRWFGSAADSEALERHFTVYMFREAAPPWVRHFCREVLEQDRLGSLEPEDFGVSPVPETLSGYRKGVRYTMIVALVTACLHAVAMLVASYDA